VARPIIFATDFGAGTEWVGVCHAVIASIAPEAHVLDLAHTLPRFDIGDAGLILREAMPYAPLCVGVLVVDPGVGTDRRSIVVLTGRGDLLVGPDNGLLPLAGEHIGGIAAARALTAAELFSRTTSPTFHARDVFCPAAARLSMGFAFEEVGAEIDTASLVRVPLPLLEVMPGRVICQATDIDTFGNIRLSARPASLGEAALGEESVLWVLGPGGEIAAFRAPTFGAIEFGRTGVVVDSFGWLCLCVNRGSAAQRLEVERGSRIELRANT
jgi:S-adenosyl-L-methionine hydrolase (adenosine-forming)